MLMQSVKLAVLWRLIVAATLVIPGVNFSIRAQSGGATTGEIIGQVLDIQQSAVPAALLTARRLETNVTRQVQTNEGGSYQFLQLPPGDYELTVEAAGFETQRTKLTLTIGTTESINFTLQIGQTSDVVEVQADEESFNKNQVRRKTESSAIIDRQRIDNLPINQRDFLDFSITSPRVREDRIPNQGVSTTSKLSFNGQSGRFNNITVDGLSNVDYTFGGAFATFSQEAVREFQVVSDSYSAEFGRALGGIVNIVTRSGGNEWHGTAFGFFRNDTISARDAFATFKPPYSQYQFGGSVGGPIQHDRAFFFTAFERRSIKQNNIVTISDATVETVRRNGFQLRNGPIPFSIGSTTLLTRLDATVSPQHTFWVRYNGNFTYNGAFEPFGALNGDTGTGLGRFHNQAGAASYTYSAAGLNLVNEARFLYSRYDLDVQPPFRDLLVNLAAPEGNVTFGQGTFLPQTRSGSTLQILDTATLVRGRHQLKFGLDFLRATVKFNLPVAANGAATFNGLTFSGLGPTPIVLTGLQAFDPALRTPQQKIFLRFLATVLPVRFAGFPANVPLDRISLPTLYDQGFGALGQNPHVPFLTAFAQDDLTLRPNLLFKAGIRYDRFQSPLFSIVFNNFSPRLALSYNPSWLPGGNLFLGYGMFFAEPPGFAGSGAAQTRNNFNILSLPFPLSVLPLLPPNRGFPPSDHLPPQVPFIPQFSQELATDPQIQMGYTQQVTAGIAFGLSSTTRISATYVFVGGRRIVSGRDINPIVRPIPGDPLQSALTGRVDPTRGSVYEFASAYNSNYHALTLAFEGRFSEKTGFQASYTFSKALDDFLDFRFDQAGQDDSLHPALDRSLSVQDVRHRVILSGLWNLDSFSNPLWKGFQLSTILRLESGRPYNLLAGVDLNGSGDIVPGDRPRVGGVPLGRNVGITPGFANVDLRLARTIKLTERVHLQAIAEVFNLFNRTNISEINPVFPPDAQGNFHLPSQQGSRYSASPDHWKSAFAPRQFQFGFRVTF